MRGAVGLGGAGYGCGVAAGLLGPVEGDERVDAVGNGGSDFG